MDEIEEIFWYLVFSEFLFNGVVVVCCSSPETLPNAEYNTDFILFVVGILCYCRVKIYLIWLICLMLEITENID